MLLYLSPLICPVPPLSQLPSIVKALVKLKKCQSKDTARCLLQLIALTSTAQMETDTVALAKLEMLSQLSAANLVECNRDIKSFRKKHPKWIPKCLSDAQVAKLLGVLNTNQIELEEFGGSGLFVLAAISEHSCRPNCSFTTSGSTIFVTATTDIPSGTRLSLDYSNNFYHPTAERIASLQKTYGFRCNCDMCIGPDIRRSFRCTACADGLVCSSSYEPTAAVAGEITVSWGCLSCGHVLTIDSCYRLVEYENRFIDSEFDSLDQVLAVKAEGIFHPSHYALFWAIEGLSSQYAEIGRVDQAMVGMLEVVQMLDTYLPGCHHEKVLYLDKLGQLAVSAGDILLANESFRRAYEMSVVACGREVPLTMKLRSLYEKTPQTVSELKVHYPDTLTGDNDDDSDGDGDNIATSKGGLEMDW